MKFKADRATLLKALAHIQSVAEKRNTIPILANARLEVKDGKLSFTATDMEIAVVEEVATVEATSGSRAASSTAALVNSDGGACAEPCSTATFTS